ncbi:MAG: J domain-containing protein [Myxococcota bacterium]
MVTPSDTVSALGSAMLTIARKNAAGILELSCDSKTYRLYCQNGRIYSVTQTNSCCEGTFQNQTHHRQSYRFDTAERASSARAELKSQAIELFLLPPKRFRFIPCSADDKADRDALRIETLVLAAARKVTESTPLEVASRSLEGTDPTIEIPVARRLREAPLWPWELAVITQLESRAPIKTLLEQSQHRAELVRFVYALRLLRITIPGSRKGDAYPLLLKKRRQVRDKANWRELLDLPEQASALEAKRSLRRLVSKLHPDKLDRAGAPKLVASEVVAALVHAAAESEAGLAS